MDPFAWTVNTPWEFLTLRFLPVLRGLIVRELLSHHGLRQTEVARAMGITQPAVSLYAHGCRGADTEILATYPELPSWAREIAQRISAGAGQHEQTVLMSRASEEIRRLERFCTQHRAESHVPDCNVCYDPKFRGSPVSLLE